MSRVAKNPVKLPAGVEIKLAGQQLSIKGAKGALELKVHPSVEVIQDSGELRFAARNGDQQTRAMAGTTRALVNNMVVGVSQGFERKLQLVGVGYKAQAKGQVLSLSSASPIRLITNCRPASSLRPQPDRYPDQGYRQAAGRSGCCRNSRLPSAGALQRQGRALRRRSRPS